MSNFSAETLAAIRDALSKGAVTGLIPDDLLKAWNQSASQTTGITAYDLEGPAKSFVPVITPLRNRIPRVGGGTGIATNWKAVTAVNTGKTGLGVAQGLRAPVQAVATKDYTAPYKTIGLEDYVTFEADLAAKGFDDVKALAVLNLLRAVMIGEEGLLVGGNASIALGTAGTPTLVASASGGTLATITLSVIAVALTHEAYVAADQSLVSATSIPVSGNRTLADGNVQFYNAGTGQKSANATVAVTGATGSATASIPAINGAVGYAWFWGLAGAEVLGAISTINSVKIIANATGTQTPASFTADFSQNSFVFDGLLSQIWTPGSGSYVLRLATGVAGTGTPLTADTEGGVVEIDTALQWFWDNLRLSPTDMYIGSAAQSAIYKAILQGGTNTATRFVINVDQGNLKGGFMVKSYLNKFTMAGAQEIGIHLHPNMPPGMIMFYTDQVPYPLSNVANVLQVKTRRDYYQLEWPLKTRRYEYGVYSDELLQNYFPPAFGVISNIAGA